MRIGRVLPVDWLEVPAGTLVRGTPSDEIDAVVAAHADLDLPRHFFAKEAPRAEVAVPAFAIGRTPVTVAQVAAWRGAEPAANPDHPADGLTFAEAEAFCSWFSDAIGARVSVPTELEWERAARGDDGREYPWGDRFDPARANLVEHGAGRPLPVGTLPAGASPFGVLDLAGNVDEWTSTVYGPYPGAPDDVPRSEEWSNDPHVTRGGGHVHSRDLARCARRHGLYGDVHGAGLRLVRRDREG